MIKYESSEKSVWINSRTKDAGLLAICESKDGADRITKELNRLNDEIKKLRKEINQLALLNLAAIQNSAGQKF